MNAPTLRESRADIKKGMIAQSHDPVEATKFRFWFHYNKPASRREGVPVLTLHWKGTCHRVHNISCAPPSETHHRKSQPQIVVRGWAHHIFFDRSGELVDALIT